MPKTTRRKADPRRPAEIGAPLAGKITKVLGANGNSVKKGQIIMVISAMKMVCYTTFFIPCLFRISIS